MGQQRVGGQTTAHPMTTPIAEGTIEEADVKNEVPHIEGDELGTSGKQTNPTRDPCTG